MIFFGAFNLIYFCAVNYVHGHSRLPLDGDSVGV